MEELKQLPDGGTRKKYKEVIFALATTFAFVVVFAILAGWVERERVELVMLVFESWAALSGVLFGLYAASENAKKHSFATMNK